MNVMYVAFTVPVLCSDENAVQVFHSVIPTAMTQRLKHSIPVCTRRL